MWYFPSFTNLELSSMLMSSVPTLNTTRMLPLSWGVRRGVGRRRLGSWRRWRRKRRRWRWRRRKMEKEKEEEEV
jgi:hypothetical protein